MAEGKPIAQLTAEVRLTADGSSAVASITRDAKRIQATWDQLNAKKAQDAVKHLADTVERHGGVANLSAQATLNLGRRLEALAKQGATVALELQPAIKAVKDLKAAEEAAASSKANKQDLADAVTSRLGLGTGVANLGAAAGGLLAVGAMAGAAKETYELIRASAELADTITDLAGTYQVSTDEIQTWQRIQKDTGVTVEAIGASVTAVSKLLVNSPDKFKEWGMDVEHLRSLQPEQLLGAMGQKLQALSGRDRLAFVEDFKIANELMPHLLSGFDQLREKSAGSINPLSASELENLKGTHDAIKGLESAWTDLWTEIGNALGSDAQVQQLFANIKDSILDLVKAIADNREELALGAKLVLALANGPVLGPWDPLESTCRHASLSIL